MLARVAIILLVSSLLAASCGGGSDDQTIADLEAQIADLEDELASVPSSPADALTTSSATATTSTTTAITTSTRATTTTSGEPIELELTDSGFSDTSSSRNDMVSYAVVFENPNPGFIARRVDVNISWFEKSGSIAGTTSETISFVLPTTSAATGGTAFDVADAASMEVQFRVGDWEKVEPGTTGGFETSDIQVSNDRYSTTVVFLVESSFIDDIENPKAVAAFRDVDGSIIGGAFTFIDFVPGGGSIPAEISAFDELSAQSADIYIQPSNLSF